MFGGVIKNEIVKWIEIEILDFIKDFLKIGKESPIFFSPPKNFWWHRLTQRMSGILLPSSFKNQIPKLLTCKEKKWNN